MMAEGVLEQVTTNSWRGKLRGRAVEVSRLDKIWNAAVIAPGAYTEVVLSGLTMAAAARRARQWLEAASVD